MFLLDAPVSAAYTLVSALADRIEPVAGGLATAMAIAVFTASVRLLLVPLAIRAATGERTRLQLMPKIQAVQKKHARNPERLKREMAALYAAEGATPFTGCLPMFAQLPFFMVMYRLFVSGTVAGHQNLLLAHTFLGAPLGQNWISLLGAGGVLTAAGLVFIGLFAALALVAWWTSRRAARTAPEGPMGTLARLMPFGTVVFAAFIPLAAGLYLLTTTTWTAVEKAVLHRRIVAPAS